MSSAMKLILSPAARNKIKNTRLGQSLTGVNLTWLRDCGQLLCVWLDWAHGYTTSSSSQKADQLREESIVSVEFDFEAL